MVSKKDTGDKYALKELRNKSEVKRVLLTEYNAKKQRQMDRADAREEGREAGIEEKTRNIVFNMLKRDMSDADICALAECNQEFVDNLKAEKDDMHY